MFADRKRPGVSEARRPAYAAGPSRGEKRDDALEAQAERIAAHAMSGPGYTGEPAQPVSRAGPRDGESSISHAAHAEDAAHAALDPALAGTGAPLAAGVRADMERRIGFDFSAVRIHNGAAAARSAQGLSAQAYTFGPNIVFGAGQFAPHTAQGRHLLAHELVHVAQQAGSPRVQRKPTDPDELAEISQEDAAVAAMAKRALASGKPEFGVHEVMWRIVNSRHLDMHFELSGSHYDKSIKGVSVQLEGKGTHASGTLVAGDDALKQVAQGKVEQVAAELEKQIGLVATARGGIDIVFIMGEDDNQSNQFFKEAKIFFKKEYPKATMFDDVRSFEGIIEHVNSVGKPVANLIIVSHANADGTLQFVMTEDEVRERIATKDPNRPLLPYSELKGANARDPGDKGALPRADKELVGAWTNVLIRGCNLGRSVEMLGEVQKALGGNVRVIAPTHAQHYGGGVESLADPYYEEPGKSKLADKEALKRIEAKPEYGFVTDWKRMEPGLERVDDKVTEIIVDNVIPAPGQEMAYLKQTQPDMPAKDFKFDKSHVEGNKTAFGYVPINKSKGTPFELLAENPPTEADAIAEARKRTPRPDAFTYKMRRVRNGLTLRTVVDVERTEWRLHHKDIRKRGQPFNPSLGRKPWYGDTDN
ncbi:DUF4157 domain-containing protein [Paraburkholderia silviterrae]|nr:DUF4157 domain-containing protein [Paraburkholderia silviterrae]